MYTKFSTVYSLKFNDAAIVLEESVNYKRMLVNCSLFITTSINLNLQSGQGE
jgi:hypothetical protein